MKWIKYPNITLFILSVLTAVLLSRTGVFASFEGFGNLDYLGAFVSGLIWPFTFATPLAVAGFFYLSQTINIWMLIAIGGTGALISDLLITKIFKGGIFNELERIWQMYENHHKRRFSRKHKPHLMELFHSKPLHFISLFIGVLILFSPLPDELGLEMLSYYKLSTRRLIILSVASSVTAIWLVAGAGRLVLG